ncbi:MAG: exonuclease SbcCD subunit D [Actinomycetes bacterium]
MRLLHTSDWHLGRTLHNESLFDAQQAAMNQIVEIVDTQGIDAVLVSGDIFDRAVPPVESVTLLAETLRQLTARVPVVVISGNHDSAVRLGFGSRLFANPLHLRTGTSDIGHPVELADAEGTVLVYPVPFLDPDAARHSLGGVDVPLERSHEAVLSVAMGRVRADLRSRRSAVGPGPRSVVMAHAFVVGGQLAASQAIRSDSERDIRVGGTDSVPADLFAGVDYVALGHLHGAQQSYLPDPAAASGTVLRYSGSPLRYSFSEARQTKSVTVVDVEAEGPIAVSTVALTQPRDMAVLVGPIDELLDPQQHEEVTSCWAQVTVTDPGRPEQMVPRLRERFPHALVVRHVPASGPLLTSGGGQGAEALDPLEVAESFVRYVTGADATPAELDVFRSAYESVNTAQRSS